MELPTIYTVGHSTHEAGYFLSLLAKQHIDCLIDVRSVPYSHIAPQFNKDALVESLKSYNIKYAHFKSEFGARQTSPLLLDENGVVDFQKVRETEEFKRGVRRLKNGVEQGYKIALMCSEANPFDCHRFSMISYQLIKEGLTVKHVLKDGRVISNSLLEADLLLKYQSQLHGGSLFDGMITKEEQLEIAYKLRNRDIGYSATESKFTAAKGVG